MLHEQKVKYEKYNYGKIYNTLTIIYSNTYRDMQSTCKAHTYISSQKLSRPNP